MAEAMPKSAIAIRAARPRDADRISKIDAQHTGEAKNDHWKHLLATCRKNGGVAFVAEERGDVCGFLLGEVRAWEFGSPPTGWVYAVGVAPHSRQRHVGQQLLQAALGAFATAGVRSVRTMVRRDSVDLLRFFRGAGFVAGPFVELEAEL